MKYLTGVLFLVVTSTLWAYDGEAIYNALDVPEMNMSENLLGASITEKSVGDLSCVKTLVIVPDATPSYECQLHESDDATSSQSIYEALDVIEESLNPGIAGAYNIQKSIGGLICQKSRLILPDAPEVFACLLE